ncbi:MAG: hypothetical protein ACYC7F_14250 [Gemmatimonadaceae bacterium]
MTVPECTVDLRVGGQHRITMRLPDAVLYCFIWLFFSAAGAGALSLDARRQA